MLLKEISNKRIAFQAFDWGLGHVYRSLSYLKTLQKQGNSLVIVCTNEQEKIFAYYLHNVSFQNVTFPSWNFSSENSMLKEAWKVGKGVYHRKRRQKQIVKQLIKNFQVELLLSDHCYGFTSKNIPSVFVTHQLKLPPTTPKFASYLNKKWQSKFSSIWIIDDKEKQIAGILSQGNGFHIGIQSRFQFLEKQAIDIEIDNLLIVSGPRPYNLQLQELVIREFEKKNKQLHIISPVPTKSSELIHFSSSPQESDQWILHAKRVISRTGYSTIMDVRYLNTNFIGLATPKQLEQEYLAEIYRGKGKCFRSSNVDAFLKII